MRTNLPMAEDTAQIDVAVIGAGCAGLAAAQALCAAGRRVLCLEARDRIGGRIWTVHEARLPAAVELGAEFIHGRPPEIWQLIRSAHLKPREIEGEPWCAFQRQLRPCHEFMPRVEDGLERVWRFAEEHAGDLPLIRFLDEHCASLPAQARDWLLAYVEGFHAADPRRVSVRSLARDVAAEERIDGDSQFRFPGGYDALLAALRPASRNFELRLATVVEEIRWSGERVEIYAQTSGHSRRFAAAAAVITLPLSLLKLSLKAQGVCFVPPLEAKRAALDGLEMGHAIRATLVFRRRFWADSQFLSGSRSGEPPSSGT